MSLNESVSSFSMVYECIWKRTDVHEAKWRYMKVYDGILMWMVVN